MLTIYKYAAPVGNGKLTIEMPTGAEILCVQVQGENGPQIWARVDSAAPKQSRQFHWAGTGHPIPIGRYIGTVQGLNGVVVFHLFEI